MKTKEVVDREKLEKESLELEKELGEELKSNVTKGTEKARVERVKKVQQEKELHQKIRDRQKKHVAVVKKVVEEVEAQEKMYGREDGKEAQGPSDEPTWFPPAGSATEEEEFKFEKVSISGLLNEWVSLKKREEMSFHEF